jgi:hypothetical protein
MNEDVPPFVLERKKQTKYKRDNTTIISFFFCCFHSYCNAFPSHVGTSSFKNPYGTLNSIDGYIHGYPSSKVQ